MRSGTGWGLLGRSGMVQGTLGEVWDGSGENRAGLERVVDSWVGPVRVGGPTGRSGTGRGTLKVARDGLREPRGGPGRVGGPLRKSGTGWGTLGEVRNRSRTLG